VAFVHAGPGAILAFALNGVIAIITAISFGEMSRRFPESGGTYSFARRVLSLEAAFGVGWTAWFASIVAAVLYAIGFAVFAMAVARELWSAGGSPPPEWLGERPTALAAAAGATLVFAIGLMRPAGGGTTALINLAKVLVFAILIVGGLWALARSPAGTVSRSMTPLLPSGPVGLIRAMGFTFIALQGFDLIAAVAGEVRDARRTVPRAMLLSLGIALTIYVPLLLVVSTVGVEPGSSITATAAASPETIVADAARRFLGTPGYWMVLVAGVLAMLSALQANLLAASRMASSMARDRTLPRSLATRRPDGVPANAIAATTAITLAILLVVPDVAAAGAAASLIFLVTFAIVHVITILARRRAPRIEGRPAPAVLPAIGGAACVALAVFQGIVVPSAGVVSAAWLGVGGVLFVALFAPRARARDAAAQATDPDLLRLRGRSPLVLVPIVNPTHAEAMVGVANALVAPGVGRVLLLSIVSPDQQGPEPDIARPLAGVQAVLGEALRASFETGLAPEALTTLAHEPWREIGRVARTHRCEAALLGLGTVTGEAGALDAGPLERLVGSLPCDAIVLRSPEGWSLDQARRVLIPIGGRSIHDILRARLVGSLCRTAPREIHYVRVVPAAAPQERRTRVRRALARLAEDEAGLSATLAVLADDDPIEAVISEAEAADLIVLGVRRTPGRGTVFGEFALRMARDTACPLVLIRHS
jgi:amino acid transporter